MFRATSLKVQLLVLTNEKKIEKKNGTRDKKRVSWDNYLSKALHFETVDKEIKCTRGLSYTITSILWNSMRKFAKWYKCPRSSCVTMSWICIFCFRQIVLTLSLHLAVLLDRGKNSAYEINALSYIQCHFRKFSSQHCLYLLLSNKLWMSWRVQCYLSKGDK